MSESLRILMVNSLPGLRTLGAARVQIELADALRAKGHEVDLLTGSDVFPTAPRGPLHSLLRSFPKASAPQVRRSAHRYDIIDAQEGDVILDKTRLRFEGLLVARTAGLRDFYAGWDAEARHRWPYYPRGRLVGRLPRRIDLRRMVHQAHLSRRYADGFFVCNAAELTEVAADMGWARVRLLPFGLPDSHRVALNEAARARARGAAPRVAVLGTWDARKGKYDLPHIIQAVRRIQPEVSFVLLGTYAPAEQVLSDIGAPANRGIDIYPSFEPEELPELLAACTAMAFPSYLEGFPFAVIEGLAAGLPVVAYDVPGPRDILTPLDPGLLVGVGDITAFTERLLREIGQTRVDASRCIDRAAQLRWSNIADDTLDAYGVWRRSLAS